MKKFIAIVLVIFLVVVIDQKPWRDDVAPAVSSDTHAYPSYNYYGYDYGYDDDYDQDDSFTMDCNRCHGSGKCEDCGGSGKSKLTGVLGASGCALCDASGRCYKCNGKNYTVNY